MPITLDHVSYTYAPGTPYTAHALHDITLQINDGEFVGIMGRTGCGKSTLIQLIAGLLPPAGGTVLLDGEDINSRSFCRDILRRKVGVVFQYPEYQLFESTVERDVAFGLRHFGWTKAQITDAVKEALELVGFDYSAIKDKSPLSFSGGEKRRIAIAGILAAKPQVLILDEPIAGLDPLGRDAFLSLIDRLNREGVTILMISHNADALAEHAGRIIALKDGRLILDGSSKEVFSDDETLRANGIGCGQIREIARCLQDRGFSLPPDTVRYEDLLPHLIRIGKGECS